MYDPADDPARANRPAGGRPSLPIRSGASMTQSAGPDLRLLSERALRASLLSMSKRRGLGRIATRLPLTRAMVERFVAGQTLPAALEAMDRLRRSGLHTTVDVLGESVHSAEAAEEAADRYRRTLEALATAGLDRNVSVKLSQMGLEIDPALCRANVQRVVERAAALGAFVRIDMEDHTTTDATLDLVRAMHRTYAGVGVVIQAALRRSAADVDALIGERIRVRLCKGAYNEPESVAFRERAEVDRSYAELMERLLLRGVYPAIAGHDERLLKRAADIARRNGIAPDRFEFQMLYGVRRDLQERLASDGWTVRVYVPYGSEWYPYFMRRLAERPANIAFVLRSVLQERRPPRS